MSELYPEGDTPTLSTTALGLAVADLGTREVGGNNRGAAVEAYLAKVGLAPGQPWCAAALYTWFDRAAAILGLVNPVPKTGSTLRLWALAEPYCREQNPVVGSVYVLRHSATTGHVGIVESIDAAGVITEISGNTNRAGSREGDSVWRHTGQPEVTHGGELLGFLVFDRAAQGPPVA